MGFWGFGVLGFKGLKQGSSWHVLARTDMRSRRKNEMEENDEKKNEKKRLDKEALCERLILVYQ